MVSAALYIRESSVETIAMMSNRQKSPSMPGGSRLRMVTVIIICWKSVRNCWKSALPLASASSRAFLLTAVPFLAASRSAAAL